MAGKRKTLEHTCAFLRPVAFHFWTNCSYDNFNNSAESVPNAYECSSTNGEAPKFRMEFLIVPGWEYWLRDSSGKSKTINSSFPPKKNFAYQLSACVPLVFNSIKLI